MRYLKSTAFLLLALGSSVSVLSRSAIAQLAEEADSASLTDKPAANSQQDTSAPLALESTADKSATEPSNRLSLTQFRALAEQANSVQTNSVQANIAQTNIAADTREIAVTDRTTAESRTEQIAQTEDLPVLEETPPTTAAPGDPAPSDPGVPDLLPNGGIQSGPDVVQPIPNDAPIQGAEPELGDLPDILFADPNPLSLPATLEGVEIERNPVVTLEQAIELAYRNSQTLQASVLQLEQAEAVVDQASAANLPTLSTSAGLTSQQRDAIDGGFNPLIGQQVQGEGAGLDTSLNGSLRVDYDLLTGGRRAANIQQAELQRQVAALTVETQQEQIRLTTANSYYQLQEAGEQIRIQRTFLEEAERNLRDSRLRQEVGVGTRFDTLRAEVQYANARQQVIQAQGNQRIARRDISRLLNLPPTAGIQTSPVSVAENWPLTLEESILLAFDNRAELEQQIGRAHV